jgi:pimeloyl-ACP methyl ester carboxylesterase
MLGVVMELGPIRYTQNGDSSIAYTTFGEGDVDLIFVGGFVSHLEIITELSHARRFWARLGSFARVVAFDKRGMGLSDRDIDAYTIEGVVEDMIAVLDAVGWDRAAVFGVSEGGTAATLFAATHPERTSHLVQFGTYARMAEAPDFPEGFPPERMRRLSTRMREQWGEPALLRFFAPSWEEDRGAREWWARLLRNGASPAVVRSLEAMYEQIDVRPLLPLVKVPTLVLWRADDRLIPSSLSRPVAEGIPGARGVELEGDAHLFLADDQDALLGEVEEFLTGQRGAGSVERALATVLFTDIVGSTERAASEGDARWRQLLDEHDRVARRAIERERGRLVKTTGDGVLASFDGPARAINAATQLRQGLAGIGLQIRAGVHTGECERIGEDLGGIAVHIGARVGSAAGPGEVLVSQTVRDLVVGSGIEFEDRGARQLKGVPGEWRLFAVEAVPAQ